MCLLVHLRAYTQTYLDIIPRERESAKLHKLIPTTERTNLSNTLLLLLRSYFFKDQTDKKKKKKVYKMAIDSYI